MKNILIRTSFVLLLIAGLSSCLDTTTTTTTLSSDPTFRALTFGTNTVITHISEAKFSLELDTELGDSIIVNLDSLPYQTRIDSVFPHFTWNSSIGYSLLLRDSAGTGLDTVYLTGTDTIDFNRVISVTNVAEDDSTKRTYPIKVNVHKVEGNLYVWKQKKDQIMDITASQQKVIFFNDQYSYFAGTGVRNYLYTSSDAETWAKQNITGLPAAIDLKNMQEFNGKLYLALMNGGIYSSETGLNWTSISAAPAGMKFMNLLFTLNSNLWSIVDLDGAANYHIASSADGTNWNVLGALENDFPVGDFTSLSFASRTGKPKALVLGGYDANGKLLRNVWTTEDGQYWVDYSIENNTLGSCAGATVVPYNNMLLLFGGMNADNKVVDEHYMYSVDEGLSWRMIDSTYNTIYDSIQSVSYQPRSYQSVILSSDKKTISLFGGKTGSKVFSDLWTGKLTKLDFLR